MAITLAGSGLVMAVQGVPDRLYAFAALQFAIGIFFSGIQPSINAIIASHTDRSVKGTVFGLLFSAQQMGSIAGPMLGGLIATFFRRIVRVLRWRRYTDFPQHSREPAETRHL